MLIIDEIREIGLFASEVFHLNQRVLLVDKNRVIMFYLRLECLIWNYGVLVFGLWPFSSWSF